MGQGELLFLALVVAAGGALYLSSSSAAPAPTPTPTPAPPTPSPTPVPPTPSPSPFPPPPPTQEMPTPRPIIKPPPSVPSLPPGSQDLSIPPRNYLDIFIDVRGELPIGPTLAQLEDILDRERELVARMSTVAEPTNAQVVKDLYRLSMDAFERSKEETNLLTFMWNVEAQSVIPAVRRVQPTWQKWPSVYLRKEANWYLRLAEDKRTAITCRLPQGVVAWEIGAASDDTWLSSTKVVYVWSTRMRRVYPVITWLTGINGWTVKKVGNTAEHGLDVYVLVRNLWDSSVGLQMFVDPLDDGTIAAMERNSTPTINGRNVWDLGLFQFSLTNTPGVFPFPLVNDDKLPNRWAVGGTPSPGQPPSPSPTPTPITPSPIPTPPLSEEERWMRQPPLSDLPQYDMHIPPSPLTGLVKPNQAFQYYSVVKMGRPPALDSQTKPSYLYVDTRARERLVKIKCYGIPWATSLPPEEIQPPYYITPRAGSERSRAELERPSTGNIPPPPGPLPTIPGRILPMLPGKRQRVPESEQIRIVSVLFPEFQRALKIKMNLNRLPVGWGIWEPTHEAISGDTLSSADTPCLVPLTATFPASMQGQRSRFVASGAIHADFEISGWPAMGSNAFFSPYNNLGEFCTSSCYLDFI